MTGLREHAVLIDAHVDAEVRAEEAVVSRAPPAARCELVISWSAGWARAVRRVRVRLSLEALVGGVEDAAAAEA